ncbi:EAL and GGDEF domain-containing protein [Sedimenticola hydrogenitrophicus]|uniref:sensor domain-containing protein n=1 Tax=Sedimenticola hydrogenitrophicus TaxID=2967975 RepID=UPI002FF76FD2
MTEREELQRLRDELEALRLANTALETQMLAGAEQTDAMLREVEEQRNALRDAHQRERGLAAFAQRVMDTVGSLVIVLGPDGLVRSANQQCREQLGETEQTLRGRPLDDWLHPKERTVLVERLPALPWPVHSALFETVRRQGVYGAEHRLGSLAGGYRTYMVSAAMLYSIQGMEEGAVVSAADITLIKQQEQRLRASEAGLNEAQRIAHLGSWELDLRSNELSWSPEVYRIFELDPKQFAASYAAFLALIHPDDRTQVDEAFATSLKTRQPYDIVHRLLLPGGRVKWVNERCVTRYDAEGNPLRSHGTVQDITDRRQAEEELRLAASVFDNSLNGILITEPDGRIRGVNRAFSEITGFTAREALGRTPALLRSEHHDAAFYRELWSALRNEGKWEGEIWDRRKDGKMVPVWQSISAVRGYSGEVSHYIGIFYDISAQKASEARIQRLAHYDVLTGLPNRALLLDRCERAVARAKRERGRFALLFLDLDHFKHVNDSLGHPVGDELLQAVAQRLQQTLREQDTVARLGGDEFVILLEDIDSEENVRATAQKLLAAFARPFALREHTLTIGTSIGIGLYPDHGEDVESLIKHADMALYQAKERGRGCFRFFEAQLTEQTSQRMRLERDLRQALDEQTLSIRYQPVYRLPDLALVGVEALLHWPHPRLGPIPSERFIPIAEETGLILPLGAWVLEQACHHARGWLNAGREGVTLTASLSVVQVQRGDIVATVSRLLAETGLPPEHLELALAERDLMRISRQDLDELDALHAVGVRLAIDGFGAGQCALATLNRLPVGKLKLDHSLIADCSPVAEGMAMVRAVLGLGQGLEMTVAAAGVERHCQEQRLREYGCGQVQGSYFGSPLEPKAFMNLLACAKKGVTD